MTNQTVQHLLSEDWHVVITEELEANPMGIAFSVEPEALGQYMAEQGQPCEPEKYYTRLGDIETFVIAYKDTAALWAQMCDAKNEEVDAERNWLDGELQMLIDGMEDNEYWRQGAW